MFMHDYATVSVDTIVSSVLQSLHVYINCESSSHTDRGRRKDEARILLSLYTLEHDGGRHLIMKESMCGSTEYVDEVWHILSSFWDFLHYTLTVIRV